MTELVALGEVMLRLDPGEDRVRTARSFTPRVGGGEYNVAAALSACFGRETAIATALAENEVGVLMRSLIRASGVDMSHIRWMDDGGTGHAARNGLNFTDRGFGERASVSVADRAGSAASRLGAGSIDWDRVFGGGARWLHTGGVFSALSVSAAECTLEAVRAAKRHGATVSYDVNFRQSLWRALPDREAHARTARRILEHVDVLISNEPEYLLSIGDDPRADARSGSEAFRAMVGDARARFPGIRVFAATRRAVHSASSNDWGAMAWSEKTGFVEPPLSPDVGILDRTGAGDGFVSGLVHGLLSGDPLARAVELGVAHGALVMSTPGDTSAARLEEVEALADGSATVTVR